MAKGRKSLPDNVKSLTGTLRKGRVNQNAPKPEEDFPTSPEWLTPRAAEIFDDLAGRLNTLGLASASYGEMLCLLSMRLEEVENLSAIIRRNGAVYESTNMAGDPVLKANPAVAQRSEAMRHVQSLLAEFGLSPATVGKVSVKEKDKEPNPWADDMEDLLRVRR